jgi:acyl carrier protein
VSRAEIAERIAELARRHLGCAGRLDPEQRLIEDLGLDSLKLLVLAAEVENEFRIALQPEEEAAIRTVGELVAAVEAKLAR